MNALQIMGESQWYGIVQSVRSVLVLLMGPAFILTKSLVRGSRARYAAATVLHTLIGPLTVLTTVALIVDAASGRWVNSILHAVVLAVLPAYFKAAAGEDNWWNGRMGKIRDALRSVSARRSAAPAAGHA